MLSLVCLPGLLDKFYLALFSGAGLVRFAGPGLLGSVCWARFYGPGLLGLICWARLAWQGLLGRVCLDRFAWLGFLVGVYLVAFAWAFHCFLYDCTYYFCWFCLLCFSGLGLTFSWMGLLGKAGKLRLACSGLMGWVRLVGFC